MTDTNTTEATETAEDEAQESPGREDSTEAAEGQDEAQEGAGDALSAARREAANYRRRLRETEAERDQLRAALGDLQRAEVERAAGERMASGSDVWDAGVRLEELVGEDGALDDEKVSAAVDGVLEDRPHWASRKVRGDIDQGARTSPEPPVDLGAMLRQAAQ